MRIIVAGGKHEADYIIGMFKSERHQVIVINEDDEAAKYISKQHRVPVVVGDSTKSYIFEDTDAMNADVIIALGEDDIANYITCITAKRFFNVKKAICRVLNPKRVEIFKKLGIDTVISSIYMLAHAIKEEANIESVLKSIAMDDERIVISEIMVKKEYNLHGMQIMDLKLPPHMNIACIVRGDEVMIPNGRTIVDLDDRMYIVSAKADQDLLYKYLETSREKHK
jgi:trk system potassium uptake protein TrkA